MKLLSASILCALMVCVVSGHILERPAGLACWFTGCATKAEDTIGRKLLQSASPLDTTGGGPSALGQVLRGYHPFSGLLWPPTPACEQRTPGACLRWP
jgi:hypothetical protein